MSKMSQLTPPSNKPQRGVSRSPKRWPANSGQDSVDHKLSRQAKPWSGRLLCLKPNEISVEEFKSRKILYKCKALLLPPCFISPDRNTFSPLKKIFLFKYNGFTMLLVSGVQQSASVIHILTLFQILFPYRSLRSIE